MLAIQVELLTDRYVATSFHDRELPEWPPHPARFYSALVATWADDRSAEEEHALRWLAELPPPKVFASQAHPRTAVPVFVPVNDVQVVLEPEKARARVRDAEKALGDAVAGKTSERARTALAKARDKLVSDTRTRTAPPPNASDEDLRRARAVLPAEKRRQPRSFPSVTPAEPRFTFAWDAEPTQEVRSSLTGLCARVVRIGHSSSLVRVRLVDAVEGPCLQPDRDGLELLLVTAHGQFDALERAFEEHREFEPRILPCAFAQYRRVKAAPEQPIPASVFGEDWIVFERSGGGRYPIVAAVQLARTMRAALLAYAEEPAPPFLTGHGSNGEALDGPHLAYVPLPFVAGRYADGQILGIGLILPRDAQDADRRALLRAIGAWERAARDPGAPDEEAPELTLALGRSGHMVIRRIVFAGAPKLTLRSETWIGPSIRWATATPIALDRNPGELAHSDPAKRGRAFDEAEQTVRLACEHIGLPEPAQVEVVRSTVLAGSEKASRFPAFPFEPNRTKRVLVHARLVFPEPVRGPVMIGAGRYTGLGLCRPIDATTR